MPDLTVEVLTLSPLHVGTHKPYGQFLETAQAIPGTLLRGALAEGLLRDAASLGLDPNHETCAEPSVCPFCYYTTGVVFPFCLVGDASTPSETAPRTLLTCKHAPGFRTDAPPPDSPHGVRDSLLARVAYAELTRTGPFLPPPLLTCARCDAALEPFPGGYVRLAPGRAKSAPGVLTRRMMRVALNRARETAETGLLYAVQVVAEGTRFVGRLRLPDNWDPTRSRELAELLQAIRYLGGGQSRGLGRVEVTVTTGWASEESVSARVEDFNAALAGEWARLASGSASLPQAPAEQFLSLLFLSPAMLTAPDGSASLAVTPELLAISAAARGYADLPPLEQVRCVVSPDDVRPLMFVAGQVIGGWSTAWQLPKPTALAAVAGSVYVFRARDLSPWSEALQALERSGLGGRCQEGFGAIRLCDPIHREVDPL